MKTTIKGWTSDSSKVAPIQKTIAMTTPINQYCVEFSPHHQPPCSLMEYPTGISALLSATNRSMTRFFNCHDPM